MVWMDYFCFQCSVRLGVIITAIISMIQTIPVLIVASLLNSDQLKGETEKFMDYIKQFNHNSVLDNILNFIHRKPDVFIYAVMSASSLYLVACILAIVGAYKLLRWFLVPFTIMELLRLIIILSLHVIAMLVLKQDINLGALIAASTAGGFLILLLAYLWASSVALFQIIGVVYSNKYQTLYGVDPVNPIDQNETIIIAGNRKAILDNSLKNFTYLRAFEKPKTAQKKVLRKPIISTIKLHDTNIHLMSKEFQNWHVNELVTYRPSQLLKFH